MTTLLDQLKAKNPKLADATEWLIADAIAKAQAKAQFDRQQRQARER